MGAGIAASPHCAERRICQISCLRSQGNLTQELRLTSSGVASHLIASSRGRNPIALPQRAGPKTSLPFRPTGPGQARAIRCSAALLGMASFRVSLRSPKIRRPPEAASRDRKTISSGASSRLAPESPEGNFPIACRRRSDLRPPAASSFRFRLSDEAGTAVPITHAQCASRPSRGSEIIGCKPVDYVDIGQKPRNLFEPAATAVTEGE